MSKPVNFIYDPEIPAEFALAVFYILNNETVFESKWKVFRVYLKDKKPIRKWIKSIISDNEIQGNKGEIGWWLGKIVGN